VKHYKRALQIDEAAFGVDHINTANTINNLGSTYDSQGKYDEAIAHYERSLRIKEKAFGVDHINTADTINNLGSTYDSQGKYDEAIAHYERALKIFENAPDLHVNAAQVHENISMTLLRRFSASNMEGDLHNILSHLLMSISTAAYEQDPMLSRRFQNLKRLLLIISEPSEVFQIVIILITFSLLRFSVDWR
jgi:tetratricopeptide (TPR) repeat protein